MDPDSICDSIRAPVVAPDRDVRPWQEVMVDLAHRLGFPAFVNEDANVVAVDSNVELDIELPSVVADTQHIGRQIS